MKVVTITKQQYTSLNSAMVGEKFIVNEIQHGNLVTLFLATEDELKVMFSEPVKTEAKPTKPNTQKLLQKEFAAFNKRNIKYFLVDVYSDRLTFVVGYDCIWLPCFLERRDVISDPDRGGHSISLKDAQNLGLPTEIGTYRVYRDSRRKWEKS